MPSVACLYLGIIFLLAAYTSWYKLTMTAISARSFVAQFNETRHESKPIDTI
jgi:hypothetical protein